MVPPYSGWWGLIPRDPTSPPPDPTRRELKWGDSYPCLHMKQSATGIQGAQCGGMMRRTHKRAYTFDGELWYHFKCDRCGREADDKKVLA